MARFAAALQDRLPELSGRLTDRILSEVEFYRTGDIVAADDLHASVRANLGLAIDHLGETRPPDLTRPAETGRLRARQGAPLTEVVRAFRIGFSFLWSELAGEAARVGGAPETLASAASVVWWLCDLHSEALSTAYRAAATERVLQQEQERSALVELLFTGRITDTATLWEIARLLRLPYEGTFVAVAAEPAGIRQDALPRLESMLRAHDITSAWRWFPDVQLGLLSLRGPDLRAAIPLLKRSTADRIGLSPIFRALRETVQAVHYARVAMASVPGGQPQVAEFDATPLATLTAAAPDAAQRLAQVVLGPLLELPDHDRASLLNTLQAWMDTGGSATETAHRLYCHPNTVRYRLRRIERETGRPLERPTAVAELAAALHALRLFPGLVGEPGGRHA
ncbi:PucR family transcriptional regulator [Longimycelium tulufanense]|nr:helix-turn-helix domain-containing protein [Longimycelium tulufanense]